ncbi:MAG: hypothetical protein VW802_03360 [Rhodospirillaceae bacterium]|jgi:hypothetical protein
MKTLLSLLIAAAMGWSIPASSAERVKNLYSHIEQNEKLLPKNAVRVRNWRLGKGETQRLWQGPKPRLIDICVKNGTVLIIPTVITTPYSSKKDTSGLIVKNNSCFSIVALAVSVSTKSLSAKTDAAGTYVVYGQLK